MNINQEARIVEPTTPTDPSPLGTDNNKTAPAAVAQPTAWPDFAKGGKEGKGGADPAGVTNADFMATLFPSLSVGEKALALAKPDDPGDGGWIGFDAADVERRCGPDTNNYFNCASFSITETGELRAREEQAVAYHCFVLDDVGTKTAFEDLPAIEPTWMLETSAGNFQVGYRLTTPVNDPAAVKAAQKRIFGAGLGDKGAGGMARWVRLPNGINGKKKHRNEAGKPFCSRLVTFNPDVCYELADLAERLAPLAPCMVKNAVSMVASRSPDAGTVHPGIPYDVFMPALPENPLVAAFKEAGGYKRLASPGIHEICCPWHAEHTDPEDDRAYLFEPSRANPRGGFKCHHSHTDKYRLGAVLTHMNLTQADFHNKPRIRVIEGELQAMVDAAQVVLANTGEYFQSGGLIVKVVKDKRTGAALLQPQTDADLTLALCNAARWERSETKAELSISRRCNPPQHGIRLLLQAQSYTFLPVLSGIARQPFFQSDDRLVTSSGYDAISGYYCAFDGSKFERAEPTEANARAALGRLTHLVREFHFATPRDSATALAAIFTAVLRSCVGRAPAFHAKAPAPGSGKSLLCDVIARFAGPGEPAKISFPRTEDEATKAILATLLGAPAVIDFDDMSTDWRPFGPVNRLLTSATMTDRILGLSKMATVSTDTLVLGSGNNTGPTGDLARRVVVIDLDSQNESPATLRYEGDPLRDVETNREAYVADVLLIVEAWIMAGKPRADLSPIATYGGRWTDFCRQPLVWLGLDDPAEGLIEQLKDDPDTAALGRFLIAWHAQLGSKPQTLRALIDNAEGDLGETIEDLPFAEGGPINRSKFGHYLKRNAGRPVTGLKLEKAVSLERNAWRVVVVGGASASSPPSPPLPPSTGPGPERPDPFD